jgi:SAM-dependent methyltransferase
MNKCFKLPVHPFNLENDGKMKYAEWQFDKGERTIAFYPDSEAGGAMFAGKTVLDIGCGAAGKSLYYASLGARRVVGLDVIERYRGEALELARKKGLSDRFEFVCTDAADTGFDSGTFDVVIMNDALEHVADPGAVLRESLRVLASGGRLYINFPPYFHPYGAHLSDAISVPWVHVLFGEKTLIAAYKELVAGLPDCSQRIGLRIEKKSGGAERLSFINRMTIRRFRKILRELSANCIYYRVVPLRGFMGPLVKIPGLREFCAKMVVAVLTRD